MKIKERLAKLRKKMKELKLDAVLINCEANVSYISGYEGTESYAVITDSDQYFLTDFRYLEQAQKEAKGFKIILREKQGYATMVADITKKHKTKRLGIESGRIILQFFMALKKEILSEIVPTSNLVEEFRMLKDADELSFQKEAVRISVKGVKNLEASLAAGKTEKEVQAKLEFDTKMLGSQKPAFDIIVAAGPNSSMPHAVTGDRKIEKEDMVLLDMGVVYRGYHSDLTRCFFLGKIPRLKQKVYDIVRKAQELGLKKAKAGVKVSDVDKACRDYIDKMGYGKYFGHSTGHGVGLEIHEPPGVSGLGQTILRPGMVVTVEPGIYLPGKFGVRIEDMVLIKDSGNEVLTEELKK